ncbi:hypothetical protein BH11VER1_BH11VER1_00150 [soil metagenome]
MKPKLTPAIISSIVLALLVILEVGILSFGPSLKEHLTEIQKSLAANDRPEWWDDAAVGVYYGAWLGLIGLIPLLLTTRWWTRSFSEIHPSSFIPHPSSRFFWPCVIIAIIACLALRLPLASRSLWWDEAWVVQQVTHGKWKEDSKKPGEYKFTPHDWKRAFWNYQKPTNHVPMSLAQKLSFNTWRVITGAKREAFSDLAARVPALIASCAAVVLLACLMRAWGRPGVGVAAAMVLAIHPWYLRYGVDARAYALVVPLCLSGMFAVTRLIEGGGRRVWPWVWFGLTEMVWLWAYPNAAIDVTVLNLLLLFFLIRHHKDKKDRVTVLLRFVVTNLFAALLLLQLFLPNLMQARRWAGQEADKHVIDAVLLNQTAANLIAGMEHTQPGASVEATGIPYLNQSWILAGLLIALLGSVVITVGVRKLIKERSLHVILLSAMVASSGFFAALTYVADTYFYPRFIVAVLPCLIAIAVMATRYLPWSKKQAPFWWSGLLGVLYLIILWPAWCLLLSRPIAPLHDVASFVQKDAIKSDKAPLICCYGLGKEALPIYEPRSIQVDTLAELQQVMEKAKAEDRPLYAIYGYPSFNRQRLPEGFKLLDDKALFTEVAAFSGIESDFYFRVLKSVR